MGETKRLRRIGATKWTLFKLKRGFCAVTGMPLFMATLANADNTPGHHSPCNRSMMLGNPI